MQFIKDILREESGGKYSSKKIWGSILMSLVSLAFIVDGVHFYTVNENLFNSMLVASSTLLGLTSISNIWKKK